MFVLGERIHHRRFGLGTIQGEFYQSKLSIFHIRLDKSAPLNYNMGRRHIFAFPEQIRSDTDEEPTNDNLKVDNDT